MEIYEDIKRLKSQCNVVWGFKHIDNNIAQSEKQMEKASTDLQIHYQEVKAKADLMKKQLDQWLKQIKFQE